MDRTAAAAPSSPLVASALWRPIVVGLVAGLVSGLFGVGGGILIVPGLMYVLHMPQRRAHGTSLGAVLPISIAGLIGYLGADKVDWAVAAPMAIGAVVGALIGTKLLQILPHRALGFGFAFLLFVTAVRLLTDHSSAIGRSEISVPLTIGFVLVGLCSGILAGLFGVGGGVIMVPAMVVLFSIVPAIAKGTSVAVIIPTSVMGTWRNHRHHNIDLRIALIVGLSGAGSAYLGSKVAVGMSATLSNTLFAILLLVVVAKLVADLLREGPGEHPAEPDPLD